MTGPAGTRLLLSRDELAREALASWGLARADLRLIKHRENTVYRVTTDSGSDYALRIHRAGYHSDEAVLSELEWMAALREHDVATPVAWPTLTGGMLARVTSSRGHHQCDLFSWVAGDPLGSAEERVFAGTEVLARIYLATGSVAARIHNHGARWLRPAGFERHSWDEQGCLGSTALWGHYGEHESLSESQLGLLDRAAARAVVALRGFGKGDDRYGLIHSDLVPDNLLDDGEVITIIDFDDCGFGWHLWDMATALFWHLDSESYETVLSSIIEGYRAHRPLPDSHLMMLPVFLFVRGLVYLGWCNTRRETDTAREVYDYVLHHTTRFAGEVV
jgi:Ser/Thr protein kinase RdoA (MazF antagonist)